MPSTVTPIARKPRRKKCAFCRMPMVAETICDFGWPEDPCNAPICRKHAQEVPEGDGKHVKEYCPRHKQEIAGVANA